MKLFQDKGMDYIEFESTGNRRYCYAHVIGIRKDDDSTFFVSYGHDGGLDSPDDEENAFTKDEREELARFMIELWKEYGGLDSE